MDFRQRSQEAAMLIGIPDGIDPSGRNLPTHQAIAEARAISPTGGADFDNFIIGDFARGLFGDDRWHSILANPTHALEAEEAIDASFFRNIIGQLNVTWVQQAYDDPQFVGDKLFTTIPEPTPWNLGTHIVPKISSIEQGPSQIQPGMPYPNAQWIQDYVTYPALGKFGEILQLTLEMLGTDRTGQAGKAAKDLGFRARYDLETQELAVAMGITVTVGTITISGNSFSWLGTGYNTYQTGGSNWVNSLSGVSVAGSDWTIISNIETLASNILDPYTGIVIGMDRKEWKLLCPYAMRYHFRNILGAENTRVGPYGTGTPNYQIEAPNPLEDKYELVPSAIAYQLLVASGVSAANSLNHFFLGNFKRSFKYREALPWSVIYAPPQNWNEFTQDIVQSIKVRRLGMPSVEDPRFTFQSYGS